jgi:hypothetical protein
MSQRAEAELKALLQGRKGSKLGFVSLIILIGIMLLKLRILIGVVRWFLNVLYRLLFKTKNKQGYTF